MAIVHIQHRGLKELFIKGMSKRVGSRYHKNVLLILDHLDAMTDLADCNGVKDFHWLKGKRRETLSMHVSGNYCITFTFDGKDVRNVNFEDYHS